ncbi:hypothetical protein BDV98DRAFT_563142 [Pterulicium gracile]|uniref:Uncharacterized protein n=1 Tax=Pterulicium gracile TaxID=1884261 RepID=A0A5C3QTH7_9AGAR|nr:hypothetical protein BDV98DRAFT_563142 [Pterula gracilis]
MMNSSTTACQPDLEQFITFPFETDADYQQGLESILAGGVLDSTLDEGAKQEILLKTRVFYFNRTAGTSITIEEAREAERSRSSDATTAQSTESSLSSEDFVTSPDNPVLSFAELKELIESGNMAQIPNNKVIPDRLNDAAPSASTVTPRKKPWESDV